MSDNTYQRLCEPFPPNKVKFRKGGGNFYLAYIDARDVMERLDRAVGFNDWEDTYEETPRGRIICTLSIKFQDHWVSKSDGAGDTSFEGEKGAISDAFKRAAVKFGVGRYLYDLPVAHSAEEGYANLIMTDSYARHVADLIDAANPETGEGCDAFGEAWMEMGQDLQLAFGRYIGTHWPGGVSAAKQKMRDIMAVYRERLNSEEA
jgi:hypothetical protein